MNSVSTKTGDRGESGLANGQRLSKAALIFEVLGTQDELNSWLGVVIAKLPDHFAEEKNFLFTIQNNLFQIGGELAQSHKAKFPAAALKNLEQRSQVLQQRMEEGWTTKFLYPGGNEAAAFTDVARTVSRRLERAIVRYASETTVSPVIFKFINRLSDYLFVLRCFINHEEKYFEKQFISDFE